MVANSLSWYMTLALENKIKFEAAGVQFMAPLWDANLVICLGFEPLPDGTDKTTALALQAVHEKVTGFKVSDIVNTVVSDRAAKGVSNQEGFE